MTYRRFRNPKVLILTPLMLTLLFVMACGGDASPTSAPSPGATATLEPAAVGPTAIPSKPGTAPTLPPREQPTTIPTATPRPTPTRIGTGDPVVGRLKIAALNPSAESWNPYKIARGSGRFQSQMMYETLVEMDTEGVAVPNLAESWEMNSSFDELTVILREDVPFHRDFGEFTTRDVIHALTQMARDDSLTGLRAIFQDWLDDPDVVDDHTVVFHLADRKARDDVSFFIGQEQNLDMLSKAHFDAEGADGILTDPVGTGPYQAVERALGQYVLYERVPYDHWRIIGDFDEIQVLFAPEAATRLAMVLAGEAHAASLPADIRLEAENRGMRTIGASIAGTSVYMMFGGNLLPTGVKAGAQYDPTVAWAAPGEVGRKVRQALNMAVDRDVINETLLGGDGEPMLMPWFRPVTHLGWTQAAQDKYEANYRYDPDRARELLAEAGFPDGFSATIAMVPRTGLANSLDVAEAVGGYWSAIGVDVELKPFNFGEIVALMLFPPYEMNNISWVDANARFNAFVDAMRTFYYSEGLVHFYESEFLNEKYLEVLDEFSKDGRDTIAREVLNHLLDEYAQLPLFWTRTQITVDPTVIAAWDSPFAPFFPWDMENVVAVRK